MAVGVDDGEYSGGAFSTDKDFEKDIRLVSNGRDFDKAFLAHLFFKLLFLLLVIELIHSTEK